MEQHNEGQKSPDLWRDRLEATMIDLLVTSPVGNFSVHAERDVIATVDRLLRATDSMELVSLPLPAGIDPSSYDAAVVWRPCGRSRFIHMLADLQLPVLALQPSLCFHPFHATLEHDLRQLGVPVLDTHYPATTLASLHAVRARKALIGLRLLVIDDHVEDAREAEIQRFGQILIDRFGVEVIHLPVSELRLRAESQPLDIVGAELKRWWADFYLDRGEISDDFLDQSVRLYLGLKELLLENGAAGVTVDDIGAFLLPHRGKYPEGVMPNLAYGVLVDEGYLACEEGDIEVLATELLLAVSYAQHPTMSNIYLGFLDAFDAENTNYSPEQEASDFEQCRRESVVVAAHFSTSGVLPPEMREEEKVEVRETVPSWPGQGMMAGTPRLGPVVMARLRDDASGLHAVAGEVVELRLDDAKLWYRGRWIIRIPSVDDFIRDCLHQHYAIVPGESDVNLKALMYLSSLQAVQW